MDDLQTGKSDSETRSRHRLYLLGPPDLKRHGRTVKIERQKTMALLAYLIVTDQRHSRDELATLLWPDCDQSHARANLRRCLSELRQIFGKGFIRSDQGNLKTSASSGPWTDALVFQKLLEACRKHGHPVSQVCPDCIPRLGEAVDLYRNDFFFGYSLRDSPEFDRWQFDQAERLRRELASALERLVLAFTDREDYDLSLWYARKWLALDPLHEPAHRVMMELFVRRGQTAAAIRQYHECVRVLKIELGIEPEEQTSELYRAIREKRLIPPEDEEPKERPGFGREVEVPEEIRIVTALHIGFGPRGDIAWENCIDQSPAVVNPLMTRIREVLGGIKAHVAPLYGEDLLAVLGMSQSHEDDPERAVLAALEIRDLAARSGFSITAGIHTGAAYIGATDKDPEPPSSVMGPVVNRAARLRYRALENQILVGEATYRHIRKAFQFDSLELGSLGPGEPLKAYSVIEALQHPVKSYGIEGLQVPLVGRERALGDLKSAFGDVTYGLGRFVAITGEAGIGKSRLIDELKQTAEADINKPLWLEGRCTELNMTTGYGPFLDLFHRLFDWSPQDDEAGQASRIRRFLQTMGDHRELRQEQIGEIGPVLGRLLSVRYEDEWDQVLANADSHQTRHRTFQGIRDFLIALSRKRPLILVLEDLHWADTLSLDLITLLMETLPEAAIMLVCLYRPVKDHSCRDLITISLRKCPGSYTDIVLRELTQKESQSFTEAILGKKELSSSLQSFVFQKSLGNPLYLQEILRSLQEEGILRFGDGNWTLEPAEGEGLPVPLTIQSIIQNRMDRLPPRLKQLLQRVSVIGQSFTENVIEALAPPAVELKRAFRDLTDFAFIFQERSFPEVEYSFHHVLIQEAVYQSIPQKRRAKLHRLTAETIEKLFADRLEEHYDRLAYHFSRSDEVDKAVEYLLKAGEKARSSYSNEEACRDYKEVLRRLASLDPSPDRDKQRLAACHGLAQVYLLTYQLRDAETYFRQALDLGRDVGLEARELVHLLHGLGQVVYTQRRSEEMIRIGKRGLALLGEEGASAEVTLMNLSIARGYRNKRENERYLNYAKRNARFIKRLDYSADLFWPLINIAHSQLDQKNPDEAMSWFRYTEQQAITHHDLNALAEVRGIIGLYIYRLQGDHRQALEQHQDNLELDRKIGTGAIAFDLFHVGRNWEYLGAPQKALQYYREALPQTYGRFNEFAGVSHKNIGIVLHCLGKKQEALQSIYIGYRLLQEVEVEYDPAHGKVQIGQALLMVGEIQEAVEMLKEGLDILKKPTINPTHDQVPLFVRALSSLAEGLNDDGKFREFCLEFLRKHPDAAGTPFRQWYLETAEPFSPAELTFTDTFRSSLSTGWSWRDPLGASAYSIDRGFEIRADNGGELWRNNVSSPRLMRPVSGIFAAQTVCRPALEDRPSIGGIVLWKDRKNFLAITKGARGRNEITFCGCLKAKDLIVGRGRLSAETLYLRLERKNGLVRALCSTDGASWWTVGQVEFSASDPVEIGLFAVGKIERYLYPGAFPEGSAIRFDEFRLYQ